MSDSGENDGGGPKKDGKDSPNPHDRRDPWADWEDMDEDTADTFWAEIAAQPTPEAPTESPQEAPIRKSAKLEPKQPVEPEGVAPAWRRPAVPPPPKAEPSIAKADHPGELIAFPLSLIHI